MDILKKYKYAIAGIIIGAIGGYLYYFYTGCANGSCPITSNPWISTAYGALMGGVTFSIFNKEENKTDYKQ